MGRNSDFNPLDLLGKTFKEAEEICGWNGYSTRILKEDGIHYITTADLCLDRVNFVIENNIIKAANIG